MIIYQSLLSEQIIELQSKSIADNLNSINRSVGNVKNNIGHFISSWYAQTLNKIEPQIKCNIHPDAQTVVGTMFYSETLIDFVVLECCCDKFKEEVYIESHKMRATIK